MKRTVVVLKLFKILGVFLLFGFSSLILADIAKAGNQMTMMLTSNLQGRFSLDPENQETTDPLLRLAQNIIAEKEKGVDVYLDLGNAFYPGVLSKYSSGSIMMDFLDFFSCEATLVSSADLHIGMGNLEFLQRNKHVRLLSSNIFRDDHAVFTPWFMLDIKGARVAFVGVSSKKIKFDIAEKDLYGIALKDEKEALESVLKKISEDQVTHILLVSGLKLSDTIDLLNAFPSIDMALCGGDYTGALYAGKASRIDLVDGRSIVIMDGDADYGILKVGIDDRMSIQSLTQQKSLPRDTVNKQYLEFKARLSLWKKNYLEEQDRFIAGADAKGYTIDDQRFSHLLRDRLDTELAIVDHNTISVLPVISDFRHSDLLSIVNLDYNIFTFSLSGDQLRSLKDEENDLVVTGLEREDALTVQGYPIRNDQRYRLAATQSAFEKIEQVLAMEIPYTNTWLTVKDHLAEDLQNAKVSLRPDYSYLDQRFRTIIDIYLSNIVDYSDVDRGDNVAAPVGQPAKSYSKWGMENQLDIALYNKSHRFVFSPYMLYLKQDDTYLHNLLRGTLLYDYNLNKTFRPYNKFQYETVVEKVDGLHPSLIRETVGVSAYYDYVTGKLGFGFEKKIQDPAEEPLYGLEFIIGIKYPIWKNVTYKLDLDTFTAIRDRGEDQWQIRSSIDNAVSAAISSHLAISLRYKYFYYYDGEFSEDYRNSQFITSVDLKAGWKLW